MAKAKASPTGAARPSRVQKHRIIIAAHERGENGGRINNNWRHIFLKELAETSNVAGSAARAGVAPELAYRIRRTNPDFAAQWRASLLEGYEHLEMEVLGYLRNPEPGRKMDVASALRLLAAHRETVARERAFNEDEDEQAVLESIDAFIEDMRQRRAANAAILIAPDEDDPDEEYGTHQ